jgi:hypothetical protein
MRKIISAIAVSALVLGLVVAPGVIAKPGAKGPKGPKGPKQVSGTVSVLVTPSTISATTATVTATGNVSASSSCRKDRTVRFAYVNPMTGAATPLTETAVTRSNGDYSAVLPKPADTNPPTASVVLRATVDQQIRKVGSKKKGKKQKRGRQFVCMAITGDSSPLTIAPAAP